jgi:hypothetical protein
MPDRRARPSHEPERAAPAVISPDAVRSFRSQQTLGGDVVDQLTWAGLDSPGAGIALRVRIGSSRWFNLPWLLPDRIHRPYRRRGCGKWASQRAVR